MKVVTGKYTGTGTTRSVSCGARPIAVIALSEGASFAAWHAPSMWCGRSNAFSTQDSYNKGGALTPDGFVVGDSALWNSVGVVYHYIALLPTESQGCDVVSHMGSATDNAKYTMPQERPVVAAIIKRDSALSGVVVTDKSAAATLSSAVTGSFVRALGVGSITVSAENEVNQLDGPGGLGEGIETLAFYQSPSVVTATYEGGLPGSTVILNPSPRIKAALIYRVTPGGASARWITDTMAGTQTKPVNAAALQTGEAGLDSNGLRVGATGTSLNLGGVTYGVIALLGNEAPLKAPSVVRSRGARAVWLSGSSSNIDCGTADGPLLINGPISVEWSGAVYPVAANNTDCPLFIRHGGSFGAVNSASWGLNGFRAADGAFAWPGPQLTVCTADRIINAPDIRAGWRTGIAMPFGEIFHVMATHQGAGLWALYLNGKLVKTRIFSASVVSLADIASQTGHKVTIGARWTGSAMTGSQRMLHRVARVYNVGLTSGEVAARAVRVLYDSSESDVTRGLAEEWDAANAFGATLPATILSANNGAITNGAVVTL